MRWLIKTEYRKVRATGKVGYAGYPEYEWQERRALGSGWESHKGYVNPVLEEVLKAVPPEQEFVPTKPRASTKDIIC